MIIITTSNSTPISATQRCGDHGHRLSFYLFLCRLPLVATSKGYSVAVLRLLIGVTFLVAENRL